MWLAAPCSWGNLQLIYNRGGFNSTFALCQAWISHCAAVKSTSLCCSALSNCLLSSGIPLTKRTFGTLHYSRYLALILSLCQFPLCCIFKMHFCRVTIALHTVHSLLALIGPKDLDTLTECLGAVDLSVKIESIENIWWISFISTISIR